MTGSVLFYVQHLLGIGHLRRAFRIVDALARAGAKVTLVSGGEPLSALAAPCAARIIQLAPIRARDAGFKELVGPDDRPVDETMRNARRAALLDAYAAAQPDAVLIEAFPFGRRAFRFELDALIDMARSGRSRALVLCSLRDVVVTHGNTTRLRDIVDRVRTQFDFVLVHGDPAFIPLEASFPLAAEIADRLIYTGYVGAAHGAADIDVAAGRNEVLVSAGGGAVGGALLSTALEARRSGLLARFIWRLLAGPNLPDREFRDLARSLPEGVILERYREDFPQLLRHCLVSVSQGGYNTVLDILAARAVAVVVPFAAERETEQSLRAERLAASGVLEVVRENELSPERLADAIERAIDRGPGAIAIDTGGALSTAAVIMDMVRSRASSIGCPVESFALRQTDAMIRR